MLNVATPYGRDGPSSRVRVFEWLDRTQESAVLSSYLSQRNASASLLARSPVAVLRAERRLRRMAASRPERLLLHREASPLSRGSLEQRLLTSADFAVYDFDDALQWDWADGGGLRRLAPKAPKALIGVTRADRVIAGSPVLAEWAAEHNDDVILIPSCVAHDRYRHKADYRLADPPRLGWIGSTDNEAYLLAIGPALREIHRRTGARLTVIGAPGARLAELEDIVDRVPWSESSQHQRLADFDVGLMPLPDEPYTRGKCGYKLLQYAAAGVVAVASPIGVNRQILSEFEMPAAQGGADWVAGVLDVLGRSAEHRAAVGRRARALTERHYSYDAWLSRWKQAVATP